MSHSWCPSWFSQRKLRGQAPGSALWPPGMRRTLAEDLPQRRLGQSLWPQGVPQKRFEDKGGKTVGPTLFLGSTSFPYAFRILGLRARKSFSILSTSSRSNSSLLVKAVAQGCKCPNPVVWFMLKQLFANGFMGDELRQRVLTARKVCKSNLTALHGMSKSFRKSY